MIRRRLRLLIDEKLDQPPWIIRDDFTVTISKRANEKEGTRIHILYEMDQGQHFIAEIPNKISSDSYDFDIPSRYNPGTLIDDQVETLRGEKGLVNAIGGWVSRIQEDIQAAPQMRVIDSVAERMKDMEEELADFPDQEATSEQIQKLQEFINDLEVQLKAQISELSINVDAKDARIAELESHFAVLRTQTENGKVRELMKKVKTRVLRVAAHPDLPKVLENGKKIMGLISPPDIDPGSGDA